MNGCSSMATMTDTKGCRAFILGAGCSANYGYPLGIALGQQLQKFFWDIPADCDDEFLDWDAQRGSANADQAYLDRERLAAKQILDARIATSAMFVAREENARQRGLPGYQRLLGSIFGGEPWEEAIADSGCHVLSFNYDRLLEIAFFNHFKSSNSQRLGLYAKNAL